MSVGQCATIPLIVAATIGCWYLAKRAAVVPKVIVEPECIVCFHSTLIKTPCCNQPLCDDCKPRVTLCPMCRVKWPKPQKSVNSDTIDNDNDGIIDIRNLAAILILSPLIISCVILSTVDKSCAYIVQERRKREERTRTTMDLNLSAK